MKINVVTGGVSGSMADRETIMRINALGTVYVNQEFYMVMNGGCVNNSFGILTATKRYHGQALNENW